MRRGSGRRGGDGVRLIKTVGRSIFKYILDKTAAKS